MVVKRPNAASPRTTVRRAALVTGRGRPSGTGRWLLVGLPIFAAAFALAISLPNPFERSVEQPGGTLALPTNPAGLIEDAGPVPIDDFVPRPGDRPTRDAVGMADGLLTGPASPYDTDLPAIARLDADLLRAVQQAARDADDDGITFYVTSGWRSEAYQQQLLDEAVLEHGSMEKARRFVATPETSAHVTGHAVDIGPSEADEWLRKHGSNYGLCQTYANEEWHFELATVPSGKCPRMAPDASP